MTDPRTQFPDLTAPDQAARLDAVARQGTLDQAAWFPRAP